MLHDFLDYHGRIHLLELGFAESVGALRVFYESYAEGCLVPKLCRRPFLPTFVVVRHWDLLMQPENFYARGLT